MRERIHDMLEGDSKAATLYGRTMTAIIILSLVPLCFWGDSPVFDAIEYVCTAIFIADYIARLATADMKLKKGAASFAIYPFTPMAIIDLLTILPTFLALNPAWRALRVLRLIRVLRAFRLVRYSRNISALANAFNNKRGQLGVVLIFAVAYVLVAAMVMFNVEHETFPTYFDAVYWSVVSLTTVGYGDLYPMTDVGRAVAMISSLMGIAVVALPASILTAGLMEEIGKDGQNGKEKEGDSGRLVQHEQGAGGGQGEARYSEGHGHPHHESGAAAQDWEDSGH